MKEKWQIETSVQGGCLSHNTTDKHHWHGRTFDVDSREISRIARQDPGAFAVACSANCLTGV